MCKIGKIHIYWHNYALVSNNDNDLWFFQNVDLSAIEKLANIFPDCHVEKWYWCRGLKGDTLYLKESLEGRMLWRDA